MRHKIVLIVLNFIIETPQLVSTRPADRCASWFLLVWASVCLSVCLSVSFFELEGWNSECRLYLGIEIFFVPGIFEKNHFWGCEPKKKMAILKFINGLMTSFFGLQPWKSESASLWPKPRLGFLVFGKSHFYLKKQPKWLFLSQNSTLGRTFWATTLKIGINITLATTEKRYFLFLEKVIFT